VGGDLEMKKIIVALAMVAIVGTAFYLPWNYVFQPPETTFRTLERHCGYAPLLNPPVPDDPKAVVALFGFEHTYAPMATRPGTFEARIDYTRLAFEWLFISLMTVGFLLLLQRRK